MNQFSDIPEPEPATHYMIAGQVAFELLGDSTVQVLALNSLMKLPMGHPLNAMAIGLAQQGLQAMLHTRVKTLNPAAKIKVVDVIILNIMCLGHFLPGQFEAGSMLVQTPQQMMNPPPSGQPN